MGTVRHTDLQTRSQKVPESRTFDVAGVNETDLGCDLGVYGYDRYVGLCPPRLVLYLLHDDDHLS
jgi:hypothetical protein